MLAVMVMVALQLPRAGLASADAVETTKGWRKAPTWRISIERRLGGGSQNGASGPLT
jgi:hypothetical protein